MRKSTVEFIMETPNDVRFNVEIARTVPGDDDPAYMNVKAHLCDQNGDYDSEMKILDIEGIDTLEIQCLLKDIIYEIAQMTNVHVQ